MATSTGGRRSALVALCLWMCAGILPALAQDPQVNAARSAASDWLVLSDAGNAAGSYAAAGAKYRTALSAEQWARALASARTPFGTVVQRTFVSGKAGRPEGAPEGEYAVVVFRTAFEKKTEALETLTMEREADGKWRVIGYSIR